MGPMIQRSSVFKVMVRSALVRYQSQVARIHSRVVDGLYPRLSQRRKVWISTVSQKSSTHNIGRREPKRYGSIQVWKTTSLTNNILLSREQLLTCKYEVVYRYQCPFGSFKTVYGWD